MKKLILWFACSIAAVGQSFVPPSAAIYITNGSGSWTPATTTSTTAPLPFVPPAYGAYCYNSGTGKWYPADSSCFGGGGGGAVSSVANSDGTLTISPTTGSVIGSLNLAHANTWTSPITVNDATGNGGIFDSTEGTAPSATSGHDIIYGDSTSHCLKISNNGGGFTCLGVGAWVNITNLVTVAGCTVSGNVCIPATNQASVTFSNIPGTYTHIKIMGIFNTTDGGGGNLTMQFNGDTASNYVWQTGYNFNTTIAAVGSAGTAAHGDIAPFPGSGSGNNGGSFELIIPFYTNTTWNKRWYSSGSRWVDASNDAIFNYSGRWNAVTAITSIKMFGDSIGSIVSGSIFSIYGIN